MSGKTLTGKFRFFVGCMDSVKFSYILTKFLTILLVTTSCAQFKKSPYSLNSLNFLVISVVLPFNSFNQQSNSSKDITAFSIHSPATAIATISGTNIRATVPTANLSNLVARFTHTGASINIAGVPRTINVTANDFKNSKIYTVVERDGSTKNFTVSILQTV